MECQSSIQNKDVDERKADTATCLHSARSVPNDKEKEYNISDLIKDEIDADTVPYKKRHAPDEHNDAPKPPRLLPPAGLERVGAVKLVGDADADNNPIALK